MADTDLTETSLFSISFDPSQSAVDISGSSNISISFEPASTETYITNRTLTYTVEHEPKIFQGLSSYVKFSNTQIIAPFTPGNPLLMLGVSTSQGCLVIPSGNSDLGISFEPTMLKELSLSVEFSFGVSSSYVERSSRFRPIAACDIESPSPYSILRTVDGTQYVKLPAAEFGNTESLDTGAVTRKAPDGAVQQVRRPNRIIIKEYSLTFTLYNLFDLIVFLYNTLGDRVQYVTHTGEVIEGIITTDPATINNTSTEVHLALRGFAAWQ